MFLYYYLFIKIFFKVNTIFRIYSINKLSICFKEVLWGRDEDKCESAVFIILLEAHKSSDTKMSVSSSQNFFCCSTPIP